MKYLIYIKGYVKHAKNIILIQKKTKNQPPPLGLPLDPLLSQRPTQTKKNIKMFTGITKNKLITTCLDVLVNVGSKRVF